MVRESQRWHAQLNAASGQLLATAEAVEKREFAVHVKVDEIGHGILLYLTMANGQSPKLAPQDARLDQVSGPW